MVHHAVSREIVLCVRFYRPVSTGGVMDRSGRVLSKRSGSCPAHSSFWARAADLHNSPQHFPARHSKVGRRAMKTSSRATLSVRCRFGQRTFAGTQRKGLEASNPDGRLPWVEWSNRPQSRRSPGTRHSVARSPSRLGPLTAAGVLTQWARFRLKWEFGELEGKFV